MPILHSGAKHIQAGRTARQTLAIKTFRRIYIASFASAVGRWMQNVALGVLAYTTTGSPSFTTFIVFAQTFPLLVLSLIGGSLADTVDRQKLLVATQAWQAFWGLVLAVAVADGDVERTTLTIIVLLIGIGQAIYSPAFNAVVPSLVGPDHLAAAISLNSMMINGSRVIGPVIGALVLADFGPAEVFTFNSLSYLGIILVLVRTPIPKRSGTRVLPLRDRIFGGLRLARRSPQVGRPLLLMSAFSLLCLPFIGLMPVLAETRWGVPARSQAYGNLYACFGLGALGRAASVGTVLLNTSKPLVVRTSLGGFAIALATLASLESSALCLCHAVCCRTLLFHDADGLTTFLRGTWPMRFGAGSWRCGRSRLAA